MVKADTLYIIGNGFDIHHELETRYPFFAFYIKESEGQLYDLLTQYYPLPDIDIDDEGSDKDPLWSDFENALAELDFESVLDDNSGLLPNVASDDFKDRDWHSLEIEMGEIADALTKDLLEAFRQFILNVQFPTSIVSKAIKIEENSIFLNFNYTDTLEHYYGIDAKKILYIHGKAKGEDEKLILGHGIDPETFNEKDPEPPEGLDEEQMEMWRDAMADRYDYSYSSGKSRLLSYFQDSFKHTSEIIQKNSSFFNNLRNIKKVFVLGHSLSGIDQAYFDHVIRLLHSNVEWVVSYYSDEEQNSHLERLKSMGLIENQIRLIKIEDLVDEH